ERALVVCEVVLARAAGGAAEREPHALDAIAQAPAPARLNRLPQNRAESFESWMILNQLPDRGVTVLGGDFVEIIERKCHPGGAQDREPRDAIAKVRERARKGVE